MILNKRERGMLLFLAVIVLALVYYKFLITPLYASLQELQTQKEVEREKYDAMWEIFSKEVSLDEQIADLDNGSKQLAADLFGKLTQEDIMVLFYDLLNEGNIELSQINFSEPRLYISAAESGTKKGGKEEKNSGEDAVKVYSLQLHFKAEYQELVDLLKAIREYEKRVAVSNLQISNISDGVLTGDIAFDFYSVPYVDEYFPERANQLAAKAFAFDKIKLENPFVFFQPEEVIEEEFDSDPSLSLDPYPWEDLGEPEEVVAENWTTLYGFEDQRYFFVGNPREVFGSVAPVETTIKGNVSAEIQYDFLRERSYSAANVVFDGNAVQIARQPEFLAMSIYAYETNNHKIGLIVIDSGGRQYKVPYVDRVDWSGWQTVKATLPVEVTYPAIVQRIYIESDEISGKLNGRFVFDTLEVLYPDLPSEAGGLAANNQ